MQPLGAVQPALVGRQNGYGEQARGGGGIGAHKRWCGFPILEEGRRAQPASWWPNLLSLKPSLQGWRLL